MRPIDFPGSNIVYGPSADMTPEQCESCPAFSFINNDGYPVTIVAMQLNKEDIDAVNAGRPIYMQFIGAGLRPFSAWTLDENDLPNV